MTARFSLTAAVVGIIVATSAAAQPSPATPLLSPGTITTPTTVFVPANPQQPRPPVGSAPGSPQMPPRDNVATPATGTGVISGRVTEAETGKPLRRVTVQVGGRAMLRESRATSTNDDGRFIVRDLPAGEFSISVRKPGYVSTFFGAASSTEGPRPVRLADKQVFDRADIAMQRGGVIAGRVVDDYGEPVLDARVTVLRRRWNRGKAQWTPAGNGASTNDIGEYRAFGLPPGDYVVSATMQGDFSRGESDDEIGFAPSYHPGTVDAAAALPVKVIIGGQAQADIALQAVRLGRILGVLLDNTGRPAATGRIMGRRIDEQVMSFFDAGVNGMVKPDGSFTINAVTPGRYALQGMPGNMFAIGPGVSEMADATVDVVAGEITTVSMAVTKGATIKGQVVVDGTPFETLGTLSVMAMSTDPGAMSGTRPAPVAADGTFELVGVRGSVQLSLMGRGFDMAVKSVRQGVNDVTAGLSVPSGRTATGIEIHVTKDVAEVTGTVTDARGQLLKNYVVVLFTQDEKRWFSAAGRGMAAIRPDQDGRYTINGLLGGEYLVVALSEFDASTFGDPAVMENLRAMATDLRIADAEKRALDLKLAQ